jgi:molecular chaperone DnaJ
MRLHPDKNQGKESDFWKDVQEAYAILSQPKLKSEYDKGLKTSSFPAARIRHGTDLSVILKINVSDIANESTKNIVTSRLIPCTECQGTGSTSKTLTTCYKCHGTGIDVISTVMGIKKYCNVCKGYGNYPETKDCKSCNGTGLINNTFSRHIKITRVFQPCIIIPQSGNYSIGNGNPGNLNITFQLEKTSNLEIVGKDIKGYLKISPAQAILGDITFMDVFGNAVKIVVPPGIKHGEIIKKEDAGIQKGNKRGSLLLKVYIEIPKKISEEEKKLYTQLLKLQKGFL